MGIALNPTIEEYLGGVLINYPVPQQVIINALARRNIESGSFAFQRNEEGIEDLAWIAKRELAVADVYLAASTFINGGGRSKQLGNRRFTDMNVQVSGEDRKYWRELANHYYLKHGEPIPAEIEIYDASGLWGF